MRPLRFVWRFVLVLIAIPVVVALVVGLPLGFLYLLSFASEWGELLIFVPGFALYVLGFCVPVGLVQFTRWPPLRSHQSAWGTYCCPRASLCCSGRCLSSLRRCRL
jgi:hypothetical protein